MLRKLAELAVGTGANVQPGQVVAVAAAVESAPLVQAVAECAYRRGARFVDPGYFDGRIKRHRITHADPDTSYPILKNLGFEDVCAIVRLEEPD